MKAAHSLHHESTWRNWIQTLKSYVCFESYGGIEIKNMGSLFDRVNGYDRVTLADLGTVGAPRLPICPVAACLSHCEYARAPLREMQKRATEVSFSTASRLLNNIHVTCH